MEHKFWETRNVFIRFIDGFLAMHGGFYASPNLTNAELSKMIRIVFHAEGAFSIKLEPTDIELPNDQQPAQHGIYVLTPLRDGARVHATGQLILDRKMDSRHGNRDLIHRVKNRDHGHCAITGMLKPNQEGKWPTTKMAYIFPSGQGDVFSLLPFPTPPEGVHCAQNIITLEEHIYHAWETGLIAVDPDNGYRIISFDPSTQHCHGLDLHPVCRDPDDPWRVNDDLLRWHYHQTVVSNMRDDSRDYLRHPQPSDITALNPLLLPYGRRVDQVCGPPSSQQSRPSMHDGPKIGLLEPADRDRRPTNKSRQPMDMHRGTVEKPKERSNQAKPESIQRKKPTNIPGANPIADTSTHANQSKKVRNKRQWQAWNWN